ncbi:MAG TPA: hypothetical protein PKI11_08150 [Candidatus Hydrogenedentes bacterium]|nr:hypothetical protein [Candidatus Hydrogenedentota bacterium]HNT87040.1 hypothetical protein [Candidatus Hydrogenedentota bacterium]
MSPEHTAYEWNGLRKLWHLFGCLLMVGIFYLWKDIRRPISGLDFLVIFGWAETAVAFSIDLMRFYSPRVNKVIRGLPFYGNLMRPIEHAHFNAMTYYLLAATILMTAYRVGWCREATLVMAIAVLGVADPAAAWTRYQMAKRGWGREQAVGLLAFFVSSVLVMWAISRRLQCPLHWDHILGIGFIVALVESYTKYWVHHLHPVTRRVQRKIFHRATVWLFRLYPDDNLLIPLTVAVMIGIVSLVM